MFRIILFLSLLFISENTLADNSIKICLTGRIVKTLPSYGESFINAAKLSNEQIKLNYNINIVPYFYDSNPLEPIHYYNKMIEDHCTAIIGYEYLTDLLLISKTQNNLNIPIITNYSSKNSSDIYPKNIYMLMPTYDFLAEKMIEFMLNKFNHIENVLIVSEINRDEMIKYTKSYSELLTKNNIKYDTFSFLEEDTNIEEKLKKFLVNKKYDYVFLLAGTVSSGQITKIMNNHKTVFLGTENFGSSVNQSLYTRLNDKKINSYFIRNIDFLKSNYKLKKFQTEYFNRYKVYPTLLSAYTYDATNILLETLKEGLPINVNNILNIKYEGITGAKIKNHRFFSSNENVILSIGIDGYKYEK